jgi:DNA-binding beta-propeller fold protein YncE
VALYELAIATADFAGQAVAVVAVHVPTCDEERDDERLRRFIRTLPHPVTVAVSDDASLTRMPTMRLLDATSVVRVQADGVPRRSALRAAVQMLLDEASRAGQVVEAPFVPAAMPASSAWSPTAVASDGDRIWVCSARGRQVYGLDQDGNVEIVVGSGAPLTDDGSPELAAFSAPTSLAVHDEFLVVADSHHHTLRAIDRSTGEVTTWCGTGYLGNDEIGGSYGRDQALSSPAGIVSRDGGLYVCQAGTDQLWQIDPMTGSAMAWLGGDVTGYGGDSYADQCADFGEPVGLADDEQTLWVVEARSHTLSAVDLAHVQRRTVCTDFRRPVAVAVYGDRIFVADAGQAAVFVVNATDGVCERLVGSDHGLVEPVSLAVHGDRLIIADLGADAVFAYDLNAPELKSELKRLPVGGIPEPSLQSLGPRATVTQAVELREYSDVTLRVETPDYEDGTDVVVAVSDEGTALLACARSESTTVHSGAVTVLLPVEGTGSGALHVRLGSAGGAVHYLVPATITAEGELVATLLLPT